MKIPKKITEKNTSKENKETDEIISMIKNLNIVKFQKQQDYIISFIKDPNKGVIDALIEKLTGLGNSYTVVKLISYLTDSKPEVRNIAAEVLCNISHKNLAAVGNLLKSENLNLKVFGCQILGFNKNKKATDYLKTALRDPIPNVRCCAASALGNTDINLETEFLVESLKNENEDWVKYAILKIIEKNFSSMDSDYLCQLIDSESEFIIVELLNILKQASNLKLLDEILGKSKKLNSKEFSTVFNSIFLELVDSNINSAKEIALYKNISKKLIDIIINDQIDWNIYKAINLLVSTSDRQFINIYKKSLKSTKPLVIVASINALSKFKLHDFNEILIECMNSEDADIRREASEKLKNLQIKTGLNSRKK